MIYTFKSRFATRIQEFIAQKNALGFGYLESSRLLRDFDRFCLTYFPDADSLTENLCLAWATKKDTEGNNTFRNRMMPVREFARYLNRNGETAYVSRRTLLGKIRRMPRTSTLRQKFWQSGMSSTT